MKPSLLRPLAALAVLATAAATVRAETPPAPAAEDPKSMLAAEAVALAGMYAGIQLASLHAPHRRARELTGIGLLTVAPSFGHFYAGEPRRALFGIGLRAAGLALVPIGDEVFGRCDRTPCDRRDDLLLLGLAAFVGGTIWQLIDAPFAARRANRRARARALTIVPMTAPGGGPAGLSLAGAF